MELAKLAMRLRSFQEMCNEKARESKALEAVLRGPIGHLAVARRAMNNALERLTPKPVRLGQDCPITRANQGGAGPEIED